MGRYYITAQEPHLYTRAPLLVCVQLGHIQRREKCVFRVCWLRRARCTAEVDLHTKRGKVVQC